MASLNKILIIGNLTRNPELRYTPKGAAVCEFRLASNRRFVTAEGAQKEEVCFVDVTVWGRQAESCNRFLQKGSQALVDGRLKMDSWQDKETGKSRSKLYIFAERVQFMGSRQPQAGAAGEGAEGSPQQRPAVQEADARRQEAAAPATVENQIPPVPQEAFEVDNEPADDIPF